MLLLGTAEGVRPVPTLLQAMADQHALEEMAEESEPVGRSARAHRGSAQERIGMEKDYVGMLLKRAALSRPCRWNDDDFDVVANGEVVGRIFKVGVCSKAMDVDIDLPAS